MSVIQVPYHSPEHSPLFNLGCLRIYLWSHFLVDTIPVPASCKKKSIVLIKILPEDFEIVYRVIGLILSQEETLAPIQGKQ